MLYVQTLATLVHANILYVVLVTCPERTINSFLELAAVFCPTFVCINGTPSCNWTTTFSALQINSLLGGTPTWNDLADPSVFLRDGMEVLLMRDGREVMQSSAAQLRAQQRAHVPLSLHFILARGCQHKLPAVGIFSIVMGYLISGTSLLSVRGKFTPLCVAALELCTIESFPGK